MTDEVQPEVIKLTQTILGKFVKKPPLTDKLLKKPPFRFLHDIVTGVIRETKFLDGLYTEKEMQSENFTVREMKVAFLEKLIDCVKLVTEKSVTARPSKIVSGLEATKTNELLQVIGYALNKKLDSSTAVAQILSGSRQDEAKMKTKSKTKDEKKSTASKTSINSTPKPKKPVEKKKSEEKVSSTVQQKIKESPRTSKVSIKAGKDENAIKKSSKSDKKSVTSKDKDSLKPDKKGKTSPKKESPKTPKSPKTPTTPKIVEPEEIPEVIEEKIETIPSPREFQNSLDVPIIKTDEIDASHLLEPDVKPVESVIPTKRQKTSVKREPRTTPVPVIADQPIEMISITKDAPKVDSIRPKTSLRPPSVRPSSARPGAPRLKDKNDVILPPDELIPMGKVNVIVENYSATEDQDNEETVVVEAPLDPALQEPIAPKVEIDIPLEKGHLVAQILEQIGDIPEEETKKHVEIEWEGGGKRNREAASKEMEKLRDSIQTLTRAANPLGKLMNFLQEDIDSMRSELKLWIDVNEKLVGEIKNEEMLIEESVEPLKKQLLRLDEEILKHNEMIFSTQANILKNEQKIKTLLTQNN